MLPRRIFRDTPRDSLIFSSSSITTAMPANVRSEHDDGSSRATGVPTEAGRQTVKLEPFPTSLATLIHPECYMTIESEIESPRPEPPGFVEKNGSNTIPRTLLGMPTS